MKKYIIGGLVLFLLILAINEFSKEEMIPHEFDVDLSAQTSHAADSDNMFFYTVANSEESVGDFIAGDDFIKTVKNELSLNNDPVFSPPILLVNIKMREGLLGTNRYKDEAVVIVYDDQKAIGVAYVMFEDGFSLGKSKLETVVYSADKTDCLSLYVKIANNIKTDPNTAVILGTDYGIYASCDNATYLLEGPYLPEKVIYQSQIDYLEAVTYDKTVKIIL